MTSSVATDTDYELPPPPTAVDEHQQEQNNVENNEKVEENRHQQQQEEEIVQTSSPSPAHTDENIQEEDILVEENVTPFYMNSGI
jgi:hypothetical protein